MQCSPITDIKARKAILRQKARCFVCTKSGHVAKSCPSNYTCHKCSRKHHISLWESGKPQVRMLDGKSKASCSNQEQVPCVSTGTIGCHVNVSQPSHILKSRLLLDCGSQRSFISTELRDKLNLPTIRKESVMVKTFGTEQSELKTVEVVQFYVFGKNDLFVEAFCTPVACSPLTNQRIEFVNKNYRHLTRLELADNTDRQSELKIDILISMDFFFHFSLERKDKELVGLLQWGVSLDGFWGEVIGPLLEIIEKTILYSL